ncbi:unnamed protein product (macronuclear) [Paramecium tetraurelia]|uniref:Uncharacterized protein n=1 Tax=Paramecium tetraurelia TaxID=5888 RepID=A0DEN4_PARTE|nr:uncharacterized protein GSPATT00016327001 [Paramecium tetraurelia]CAK81501.1 unnamed protein product [Paramecium tetraurelia]|eukprot:XP_001448898.1 hypothetical protein (macronuclear) [Paramecium tetraurelia strain d4-2]
MKAVKMCLKEFFLQSQIQELYKNENSLNSLTLQFIQSELEQCYQNRQMAKVIVQFRISIVLQILINLVYIINTCLIYYSPEIVKYRSIYIVWMLISLAIQKISKTYWNSLINILILINSVLNVLLYAYFMKFVINTQDNIEDVLSISLISGLQQGLFSISFFLIQSNYLMQSLTITSYFLTLMGIFEQFQNNRLWSHYILLLFTCYLLRQNEKTSRLNYLLIHKTQTNLEACKKLFDETVPASIIILEEISTQDCQKNDMLNSASSQREQLHTQENRSMNVTYFNKSASIHFETNNEDTLTERLQQIEIISMDNSILHKERRKFIEKILDLQSKIQTEIQLNTYHPFDYQLISLHHKMQCQRQTKQDKLQFYDALAQGCLWDGKQCIMLILNDATDRELRLQHLKELDNYKDNLLAAVSHDLKTPLHVQTLLTNVIKTSLENKQEIYKSEIQEIINHLEDMLANQQILATMINDLIDYSQMKTQGLRLNLTHFNLSSCVQQIRQMFKTQIELKNLSFIITDLNEKIILYSDQTRLQQILFNLISNAIKFTFSGKISLTIEITQAYETKLIQFTVQDTGLGIPTQIQNQLFKAYSTFNLGNHNQKGVGLGLVISRNLVGLLGPKPQIELISKENQGSSFIFKIYANMQDKEIEPQNSSYDQEFPENDPSPIKQMPSFSIFQQQQRLNQKAKTLIDLSKHPKQLLSILIVDDQAFNLQALKLILQKRLVKPFIDEALNGQEAVEKANKQQYDLIFMDINMPIMNGIEAIQHIRKLDEERSLQLKKTIICILSGGNDDFDQKLTKRIGADMHLGKPLQMNDLTFLLEKYQLL